MPDATGIIDQIAGALANLAQQTLNTYADDRNTNEIWGWNMPALSRQDFAELIRSPISELNKLKLKDVSEQDIAELSKLPTLIEFIRGNAVGNLPGGNAFHVYIVLRSLVDKIDLICRRYFGAPIDLEEVDKKNLLPPALIKELRQIDGSIARAKNEVVNIDKKIVAVDNAFKASSNLNADLAALQAARDSYLAAAGALSEQLQSIEANRVASDTSLQSVKALEAEAAQLVKSTKGAFAAATSVGLGKEFKNKADRLSFQVLCLGGALIAILVVAGCISWVRNGQLETALTSHPGDINIIWAHVAALIASLAAPVWLAWLITRQIGQRFRLAEDYAFKASLAASYAGYREEANRLQSTEIEQSLLQSAIARLNEEPLRHVERENESTPIRDLFRRRGKGSGSPDTLVNSLAVLVADELKKKLS